MQHSPRLDQRLHMLREEVRTMTQEKERGERVWRERLQRCQRQLKAKEEEMSRQCQYFQNFKTQLQHKLGLARDREQTLQRRIYSLEKQLLDMTVSAAAGTATVSAFRITAGTVTPWEEQERLPPMRGEGEGEEERKEERRKQWQPNVGDEREGRREGDEGNAEKEIQGGRVEGARQNSNEARLQGFVLSLQEDLRVLLEREEDGVTERRGLMEQLQEVQENSHLLGCKVEEMKAEVQRLEQSEISAMDEVEELREENRRLRQILRDAANRTPSQSSTVPEATCRLSSPSCSGAVRPVSSNTLSAVGHSSVGSSGEVQPTAADETGQHHSYVVPPVHHQAAAESTQSNAEGHSSSAGSGTPPKNDPLNLFHHLGPKTKPRLQSLSMTTETLDEFRLGAGCSRGILNPEESPSEESDALREAYRSLGLGEDLDALQEQRDRLQVALQHAQERLRMMAQENARLNLHLRKEAEEQEAEAEQESSRETMSALPSSDAAEDNTVLALAQDDLVQALNQENRALADRIQELLAHVELREEEIKRQETQVRERISKLEADGVRLEQENQEQGGLITELTKKTEEDLNTIMELQQRLVEREQRTEESQGDEELRGSEYAAAMSGCWKQNHLEECAERLVESVLQEDGPQLTSTQQADDPTAASAPGFRRNDQHDPSQGSRQSSPHVSSLTEQVGPLTKSVQSLKAEREELSGEVEALREQQREAALSVQAQTEVKQQLTRTVWGLKEEKDSVSQCLAGLRQEREQLSRTVCGLKDERDQFTRSTSGLREEKEQLTKSLSGLEGEKVKVLESLAGGQEETDQITQSLQSLRTERDRLSRAVLGLKQERDELTHSLQCLRERRDKEQASFTSQEDRDKFTESVSSLREEKERAEHSISCLKREEKELQQRLRGLREAGNSPEAASSGQTRTEEESQKQHLPNPNSAVTPKKSETQEQSDPMREAEALGAELKRSRDELEKSHVDTQRLHDELRQSEARREEAERKAAHSEDEVMRLTDAANQMEETRRENDSLIAQVKELQGKLTVLVREKTDALSLKARTEEQYNILTAQLKAKTVALEELNSEYITLKRGQGCREDVSTALVSLRTRYSDIRAKYDALLRQRSQTDLRTAPLEAKLSCLVVKCQERNSLLVQMMKAMHSGGCADAALAQQVEQLLSDAALLDYAAAFAPGSGVKTRDCSARFAPGFISRFQDSTGGFAPEQNCSEISPRVNRQCQNGFAHESGVQRGEQRGESDTSEVTPAPKNNTNSPVPTSPEHASVCAASSHVVPALKESLITRTGQLSPSASGPQNFGLCHADMKRRSSPDPSSSTGSSPSPSPASSGVGVSRRLSSPEKIISLHEQLHKTLVSSYQAPASRGRGRQPRKSLSPPAPADLGPASQAKKQSLGLSAPHVSSLPVAAASSQAKLPPAVATTPAANNSATLFNAVASRAASVAFGPNVIAHRRCEVDTSKAATSALSGSSHFPGKAKSPSRSGANATTSPKLTKKIAAIPDISDAKHTASTPATPRTTNPETTGPEANHFSMPSKTHGAALAYDDDGLVAASCTPPARRSPERSSKSAGKSTAALEKTKTTRRQPGAPAEVRSVEVIKTVGQSSLLIGWERPPLDELGCSNGTFVYGYRVFVDGDFHKSVMSSACTKCVLESVDLSVPVHISVQTLGSNGLSSNSVHAMYGTSVSTDRR